MIEIKGLSKKFNNNIVLDNIDLKIKKGDVVAVIGPSGTGKSTLLRCLNLLEQPEKGVIKIEDLEVDVTKKSKKDTINIRENTAMVFQQFNLFRRKTALENVMEGLVIVKKISKPEAEKIAIEQLKKVGLADRINYYPKQLSGGQQQRVAIARALAMNPKILLFDEPTSALDPELVGEVLETIKATAFEGNTMIIVSHEMNFVRNVANRVLFFDKGKIIEDGTPEEVFQNPKSDRAKEFISKIYYSKVPEYEI
ncbi:amino acid ABC transporter ATP-binding protein [Clostridium saccharoperbutylacetonicum]